MPEAYQSRFIIRQSELVVISVIEYDVTKEILWKKLFEGLLSATVFYICASSHYAVCTYTTTQKSRPNIFVDLYSYVI